MASPKLNQALVHALGKHEALEFIAAVLAGSLTGNVTGNVTGDVTGNVTGNVSGQVTFTSVARTATAAGDGTGLIADAGLIQFVTVTSAGANNIITLPTPTPGTIVVLHVAATGYELRSNAPATVAINGGAEADAESAIGANTTVLMICASATSWKGLQLGSDGTLAKVQVAAAA